MNNLTIYDRNTMIDFEEMAKNFLELSGNDETHKEALIDALYWIEIAAQNDLNSDYWRVLFNVLLGMSDNYSNFINQY